MWPYTDEEVQYLSTTKQEVDNSLNLIAGYDRESMLYNLWPSQLPNYDYDTYGHGA